MGIAEDLIIIILTGLISGFISHKLKLPLIIGFILGGIAISPYTGVLSVSDIPQIELLAEIGVALLLFSIGLDLSFRELKPVKAIALIGTPVQIIILIGVGIGVGQLLDLPLNQSIVLGMVISLSSTMVVIKSLMNRGLIGTLSSRVMIGVLIVQDLAAIPLMLVIPNLQSFGKDPFPLFIQLGKALLILGVIIIIGIRVIPWFLKIVVNLNSREMFLISITAIGLGVGYFTHLAGLSMAFGAFIAGLVINDSDYSHQALNDIIPLRDIFGLVFFTSIGMLIDPRFIYNNISIVIILVITIILVKVLVFSGMSIIFRYHSIVPIALGFGLAQVGEFSFVLARTAFKSSVIPKDFYTLLLTVSIITMLISPFLSMLAQPLYSLKKKLFHHEKILTMNLPSGGIKDHIIIAGGGRVGYQVASVLYRLGYPFIIIEQDFRRFERAKEENFPVIFGDAVYETVLQAANIKKAGLLINTMPFLSTVKGIINTARKSNPGIKIIVNAEEKVFLEDLSALNVFEVVQPEFEASLEIIRQSLLVLDVPYSKILDFTDTVRRDNYGLLEKVPLSDSAIDKMKKSLYQIDVSWLKVKETSELAGRSTGELKVRSRTGASVVGVLRLNSFIENPGPDFVILTGDYIAIIGKEENKKKLESTFINSQSIPD